MSTATNTDRAAILTRVRNLETDGYRVLLYTTLLRAGNNPVTTLHLIATCRVPSAPTGLTIK